MWNADVRIVVHSDDIGNIRAQQDPPGLKDNSNVPTELLSSRSIRAQSTDSTVSTLEDGTLEDFSLSLHKSPQIRSCLLGRWSLLLSIHLHT